MLHHNEIVVVKLIHLESCDSNRTKCLYIIFNPLPSVFCTLYAMNVQYMQYKYILSLGLDITDIQQSHVCAEHLVGLHVYRYLYNPLIPLTV